MKIGKFNDKQVTLISIGIISVLAVLVIVLAYFECRAIGPYKGLPKMFHFIGKKNKKSEWIKISTLNTEIKGYDAKIAQQEELEEKIRAYESQWEELNKMLPKTTGFLELQRKIYRYADENHIKIGSFTRSDRPIQFDNLTDKVDLTLKEIEGTFHDFGNFLYELYVPLKRFIVLQEFSIESGAPDLIQIPGQKVKHKISMKLVTFVERKQQ